MYCYDFCSQVKLRMRYLKVELCDNSMCVFIKFDKSVAVESKLQSRALGLWINNLQDWLPLKKRLKRGGMLRRHGGDGGKTGGGSGKGKQTRSIGGGRWWRAR